MKKAYRNLIFIIAIALVVAGVIGFSIIKNKNISGNVISIDAKINPELPNVEYKPVIISKDNLAEFLQQQQLILDIPEKGVILLKLYNFDSGERAWEGNYVLTKGKVEKGSVDNPDATLLIHSKYISQLGDFCNAMKNAKQNGDLGFESELNEAVLLWKYRSLTKYKSCFGM